MKYARFLISPIFICALANYSLAQTAESEITNTRYGPTEVETVTELGKGKYIETLRISGAVAEKVTGSELGFDLKAVPGVQQISLRRLSEMREIPKTGLFIVDADYVPITLLDELKTDGYRLNDNGELLDENGEPATVFVRPETYRVIPETVGPPGEFFKTPASPSGGDSSGAEPEKQGLLLRFPRLQDGLGRILDGLAPISTAQAASPFPFACFSWSWKWRYRGGFCRDYRAWTNAYAWGPASGGGCGGSKPHTKIDYIRAYARAAGDTDDEHCFNCEEEHAYADYDIGCFWPAHGKGNGWHYIYMADGNISLSKAASWIHQ